MSYWSEISFPTIITVFTKIIGHIRHFRWLGPNVWWDFTNLNRIYKVHRTNVWWIMKVFRVHWLLGWTQRWVLTQTENLQISVCSNSFCSCSTVPVSWGNHSEAPVHWVPGQSGTDWEIGRWSCRHVIWRTMPCLACLGCRRHNPGRHMCGSEGRSIGHLHPGCPRWWVCGQSAQMWSDWRPNGGGETWM